MSEEIRVEFVRDADGNLVALRDGEPIVDTSADLRAIDKRLAVATAIREEIERLQADVLDGDRNQKIEWLTAWLMRERDALNDHAELLNILKTEGDAP